jgi:hypothetical protein
LLPWNREIFFQEVAEKYTAEGIMECWKYGMMKEQGEERKLIS